MKTAVLVLALLTLAAFCLGCRTSTMIPVYDGDSPKLVFKKE